MSEEGAGHGSTQTQTHTHGTVAGGAHAVWSAGRQRGEGAAVLQTLAAPSASEWVPVEGGVSARIVGLRRHLRAR